MKMKLRGDIYMSYVYITFPGLHINLNCCNENFLYSKIFICVCVSARLAELRQIIMDGYCHLILLTK